MEADMYQSILYASFLYLHLIFLRAGIINLSLKMRKLEVYLSKVKQRVNKLRLKLRLAEINPLLFTPLCCLAAKMRKLSHSFFRLLKNFKGI